VTSEGSLPINTVQLQAKGQRLPSKRKMVSSITALSSSCQSRDNCGGVVGDRTHCPLPQELGSSLFHF